MSHIQYILSPEKNPAVTLDQLRSGLVQCVSKDSIARVSQPFIDRKEACPDLGHRFGSLSNLWANVKACQFPILDEFICMTKLNT